MKHLSLAFLLSLSASSAFADFDYSWSQNITIPNMSIVSLNADNGLVVQQTSSHSFTIASNPDYPYWAGNVSVTLQQKDASNCDINLEAGIDLSVKASTCQDIKTGDVLETKDRYGFNLSDDYLNDGVMW